MLHDLRYAAHVLRKNPGFTAVAAATLALGIGANTALFSIVNAVLLRPLPYRDPARIVQLWESSRENHIIRVSVNYLDWRRQSRSFDHMSAYAGGPVTAVGGELPERTTATAVTRGFFGVFGINAVLGRTFLDEEHRAGREGAAVLGYGLWKRSFGSDPNVIGKTIHMSGVRLRVVGVAAPGFQFPDSTELWTPLEIFGEESGERSAHNFWVVGRLKRGISIDSAQAEMNVIANGLEQQFPDSNRGMGVNVVSLHEQIVGKVKPAMLILLGAVSFVLLIACANVANLLLARAVARSREMAVRAAMGAGRGRLIRQLLSESLLLSGLGGAAGLLLAMWVTSLLASLIPASVPRANEISIDASVLWFTLGISVVTGILFGLLPALRISRTDLNASLKEAAGRASTGRSRRAGSVLVVTELALSMVLLIAAGLLIRSFFRILEVDPGFRAEHVLRAELSLPIMSLNEPFRPGPVLNFYRQILERTRSIPGVVAAGTITQLPLGGDPDTNGTFEIEGRPPARDRSAQNAGYRVVSPDYFRALGIPLIRGRALSDQDTPGTPHVALINRTLARQFFPGEEPLGKRIKGGFEQNAQWLTIVGVVGDVRQLRLTRDPEPEVFVPFAQHVDGRLADPNLLVRTTGDPTALASAIRELVRGLDKNVPVQFSAMDAVVAESVSQQRFQMRLLALFAGLALLLAAIGIYGVISYSVSRRTHEIGIRMALGAARTDVVRLVIAHGMGLALGGIAIGIAGALALSRVLATMLYGVSATDPLTYAGVSLLLALVALGAIYLPARRATAVDPTIALRYE
jgi:putative ABC transport system permease protein